MSQWRSSNTINARWKRFSKWCYRLLFQDKKRECGVVCGNTSRFLTSEMNHPLRENDWTLVLWKDLFLLATTPANKQLFFPIICIAEKQWKRSVSEDSIVFQWPNKVVSLPYAFLSKSCPKIHQHVESFFAKQHSKCDSYFSEITWFYILLWLCYQIWTRCNASLSCVIHIKISFHVWNLVEFKTITKLVVSLCLF